MDKKEQLSMGEKGAWLSIITYLALSALKVGIGLFANSKALLADGLNNSTDVVASIAVLTGLKISQKPPDENHPYGHYRAETIASLIASFIMVTVGLQVIFEAGKSVFDTDTSTPNILAAWVAIFSSVIMYFVYRYNKNLAKKTNSQALMAASQDNRSDSLVSLGAFVGIIGSQFGLTWIDPIAAVVVGIIICRTAWGIFKEASLSLTDGFSIEKLKALEQTINLTQGVKDTKDIKARYHGNEVLVDVTVSVDHKLNVLESHTITEDIERNMRRWHNIQHVHIHIEP